MGLSVIYGSTRVFFAADCVRCISSDRSWPIYFGKLHYIPIQLHTTFIVSDFVKVWLVQWWRWYIYIYIYIYIYHDDVIKWKHFPCYWPFVRGIHRWPVDSVQKMPVMRSSDIFFDLRLSKRISKELRRWWFEIPLRSLWRCDVAVIPMFFRGLSPALGQLHDWLSAGEWYG